MKLKTKHIVSALLALLLGGLIQNSSATHISEPILSEPITEYFLGEKIVLEGWVSYDDQSTADVLLNFKVFRPDGSVATEQSYPSDSRGQFQFEFDTNNQVAGIYQVIVTSHCLEIHRRICTYKSQTLDVNVTDRSAQNSK